MGTPGFAATLLDAILADGRYRVPAVFTQPDRPAGRGNRLLPPPVKELAIRRGIPVHQPKTLKDPEVQAAIAALSPDYLVVAAYGMILPKVVLDMPRLAPVNVHTSLLPDYRGSAPIQRAIMNGETETGVSIMKMDVGLDTGPVFATQRVDCARDTSGSLFLKLAAVSCPLLLRVLDDLWEGRAVAVPQAGEPGPGRGYAAKVRKEEGRVDFRQPAARVEALIRGLTPDPGCHVELALEGRAPLCLEVEEVALDDATGEAGTARVGNKRVRIFCQDGSLLVRRLRPQGKKSMDAASFLNGLRLAKGECLTGRVVMPEEIAR